MRIGFDYRMGGPMNAGIGRYSFELLNAMLEQRSGDTFVIFYNELNVNQLELENFCSQGAELVPTRLRHYSLEEQLYLPRILNQHTLDLVHFPNFNVPILYKGDYVVTIHDMVHHKISGHKKSRIWKFYAYKYIIEQAAKRAKKIFTVTESAKGEIVNYLGTDPDKIVVTHLAPPAHEFVRGDVTGVKRKFLLSRPYFIFVGTMERKKNIPMLAKGFDVFLTKYKYDMDLVLVGKVDPHYPEVKQQILDIPHRNRLVFTDFVTDEDQAALYQGAYAYVSASLHEGFGLPGVEAMRYGLPLVTSNTEVFNEVYDNASIYFDPIDPDDIAEQMHLLVNDQQFYAQMQTKSFNRSQQFSWSVAGEKILRAYHDLRKHSYEPELD
ncbi:MAG: glycosyltransferase family 4 protein [bacterium]|nr:glycosyltransferase family 4 protein [bacterium]